MMVGSGGSGGPTQLGPKYVSNKMEHFTNRLAEKGQEHLNRCKGHEEIQPHPTVAPSRPGRSLGIRRSHCMVCKIYNCLMSYLRLTCEGSAKYVGNLCFFHTTTCKNDKQHVHQTNSMIHRLTKSAMPSALRSNKCTRAQFSWKVFPLQQGS